ncbi:aminopeptidase N [Streptomyces somaliensis]|uniref:Aminopeptidase N n=1 Tax=Streptomyces somaliensis (strain ATCC 33201 / DSM 40738 / JCM 12659 / KCTC 9044 / NCTC 11332 / NRRL B-12077 / IP 733) TaxID=1134445 RepID=A0AA44ICK8_STRE0|nr:aminopeptidase N [Streptomyces somaliensis]NKY13779.1 aminopeptidase N [Streptomyces somaliensis DSM 40738]
MPVLTREEAQTRARTLDVQHYRIDLDLTAGDQTFDSTTVIQFTTRTAGDTFVELKPAILRGATLDGEPLDPATLDDNRLPLTGLAEGPHELRVDAAMRYSRTGEGMHRFTDPTDGETYTYTQLFLDDAQRVIAAFDQPDLKATFDVTVTAPHDWTVLANGTTTRLDDGHWKAATTPRIPTYLLAVAAGPWHSVRTTHAGLPFGLHCRRSLAPHLDVDAAEILDTTRRCFDRYHEKFDEPYPFDSYDQAFVPEFNPGAMENPGLVTFRDEYLFRSAVTTAERQARAVTIAHEMAHMWFGDLVTLAWWDDIWLNESFAEYMGYQIVNEATTRYPDTWIGYGITRKPWGYDADQRPSTHAVAPHPDAVPDTASALLNFDGISYAKGASAIRQLVTWIGEKDFLAGVNTHFTRHRFGNATLADLIDNLATATDRDVHTWADTWLRTTGIDTLTADVTTHPGQWALTLHHHGTRPHRTTIGAYDHDIADDRTLVLRERYETDVPQSAPHPRPGPRPALVLPNEHDLTYAKIRLDPTSLRTALHSISGAPDPLTRAVLWNTLRDMVRDGDLPPADYLTTAHHHLPRETDATIVDSVLDFAIHHIANRYLPAQDRHTARTTLTDVTRNLIRRTEDGENPDLRLTAVRHFIDCTDHTGTLHSWLSDGAVPGGPDLDPELRWRTLRRLAVLGATDEDTITAELHRDPSATGREGAARCRAALPTTEAKSAAWQRMFHDDTLSNYLFTATAEGFWQPEHTDLLTPYVPRYYPEATALAARRGPAIATAAGRQAFPSYTVTAENLRLGDEHLTTTDLTPALHRQLTDRLDDLRRALRIRRS